jgi:transposase
VGLGWRSSWFDAWWGLGWHWLALVLGDAHVVSSVWKVVETLRTEETHVRVTTAFNRILGLAGTVVRSVAFTDVGLVIEVRMRSGRLICPCGTVSRGGYDSSVRRWRHLDFGSCQVWLQARIRRVYCRGCGRVRTEQVPWARPAARHSKDFEDVVGWLAQRMDKTSTARLMRCSWHAVDAIVERVVAASIDDSRLDNLYRLGVDEISYKRGQRYLTVVADHDTGSVVWVGRNRDQKTFEEFFDALGPIRCAQVEAISADASGIYLPVARARIPQATVCMDPFHVIVWVNEALTHVYRAEAPHIPSGPGLPSRREWRKTRYAVRAGAEHLDNDHRNILVQLRRRRYRLWRAWELKEQLRDLYRDVTPAHAAAHLKAWCTSALRSRIPAFKNLVRRLRKHFDAIIAAVQLGLSNSRLEGINAKIRLIQRRGYGYRNIDSLLSMIYLCLGGIEITLPTSK